MMRLVRDLNDTRVDEQTCVQDLMCDNYIRMFVNLPRLRSGCVAGNCGQWVAVPRVLHIPQRLWYVLEGGMCWKAI